VIRAEEEVNDSLNNLFSEIGKDKKVDTIEKDDNFLDSYYNLYNELVG
jgi:starch synthase